MKDVQVERREWLILDPAGRCYWREGRQGYSDIIGAGLYSTREADSIVSMGRGDKKVHVDSEEVQAAIRHAQAGVKRFTAFAGVVNGVLYCYGGCGRKYEAFPLDVILPTPLWNRIAVGAPFDETQQDVDREGRGGVLCASCIVERLAALPGVTVVRLSVDEEQSKAKKGD